MIQKPKFSKETHRELNGVDIAAIREHRHLVAAIKGETIITAYFPNGRHISLEECDLDLVKI